MNKWLKLALLAFIGIIVSSLSLGALAYINGTNNNMAGMNMGAPNSANMNMNTSNSPNMNMGSQNTPYEGYGVNPGMTNGVNPMQNWMFDRMNRARYYAGYDGRFANPYGMGSGYMIPGQMQNMNQGQGQMPNMNMGQGQMNGMNTDQSQMNNMNMNGGQMPANMPQNQMPMSGQGNGSMGTGMSSSHM